jgi:hypothetical protein
MPDAKQPRSAKSPWRAPFNRFAQYTDETEVLVHLHISAVSRLIGLPDFYKEAFYWPDDHRMVVRATEEAKHAKDEAGKDFPLIHAHALLGLWSALESLIAAAARAGALPR